MHYINIKACVYYIGFKKYKYSTCICI
jgi:hypothetical protein